ncbi:hypothetical protein [Corallincola spongiicola]|uniref:DUF4303 domain-containing protein n=1 Tax=Corallincola spongiicola TaxID=2520508 RepID=A0ABY1WMF4_9GAMM|nr:hypothetical protein [Corallincola spongiicola]TAA43598.1 hypothetical protein EXY25_13660 [Corallincola spongiicola]
MSETDYPATLGSRLAEVKTQFIEALSSETAPALRKIIEQFSEQQLYHIGLYYNAGTWSYCTPFACSEQGLVTGLEQCFDEEGISDAEMKSAIRWDPSSATFLPVEGVVAALLTKTERSLSSVNDLLESLDPIYSIPAPENREQSANYKSVEEAYYDLIREVHSELHQAAVEALCCVAALPDIAEFLTSHPCILSVCSDEIDDEQFVADVIKINGRSGASRVVEDFKVKASVFGAEPTEAEIQAFIAARQP